MKQLRQWADRFDALSLRERLLVLVAALALLAAGWNWGYLGPRLAHDRELARQAETASGLIAALETQLAAIADRARQDPNQPLRARREQLGEQLAQVEARLGSVAGEFVAPQDMGPVLRDLLEAQRGLRLLRLESLQPVPLKVEGAESVATLFQHGLELEFRGDYMATLKFLQTVEALPWRLYWDRLEYTLETHPQARILLRIHTVSAHEGWIGV